MTHKTESNVIVALQAEAVDSIGESAPEAPIEIDFPGTLSVRRDVYTGPNGDGVALVFFRTDANGERFFLEVNALGPEDHRTTDWQKID